MYSWEYCFIMVVGVRYLIMYGVWIILLVDKVRVFFLSGKFLIIWFDVIKLRKCLSFVVLIFFFDRFFIGIWVFILKFLVCFLVV